MSKRVVWAKPESMSSDPFSYESGLAAYVPASALAAAEAERDELRRDLAGIHTSTRLAALIEAERARDEALAALERIVALTHSWVVAQYTVHCRHTYDDIRAVAEPLLAKARGGGG